MKQIEWLPADGFIGMVAAMTAAGEHADRENPGWQEAALAAVIEYSEKPEFLGEDIRYWAEECGLPLPPDRRAWGAVMWTAARRGIIEKAGYGRRETRGAHPGVGTIWRKAVPPRGLARAGQSGTPEPRKSDAVTGPGR